MLSSHTRIAFVILVVVCTSFQATTSLAQERMLRLADAVRQSARSLTRSKPKTHNSHQFEKLLREIDWLESRLDSHGSVVAQQASIWGESRLTKHRHEYERELEKRLNQFESTLQGSLRRADSQATGISAGLGTDPPEALQGDTTNIYVQTEDLATQLANFQTEAESKISIEPTLYNEQLSRYLNQLNELRRINEGDDTSDSPGYALNLVRVPVSILPGALTRTGYGAEVSLSARMRLTDELLPNTFRDLVINDVVDQLAAPITELINNEESFNEVKEKIEEWDRLALVIEQLKRYEYELKFGSVSDYRRARINTYIDKLKNELQRENVKPEDDGGSGIRSLRGPDESDDSEALKMARKRRVEFEDDIVDNVSFANLLAELPMLSARIRKRRAPLPYPKQHLTDVVGNFLAIGRVAIAAKRSVEKRGDDFILSDVEAFLESELSAAYQFLAADPGQSLWAHCNEALVESIRQRRRRVSSIPDSVLEGHTYPPGTKSTIDLLQEYYESITIEHPRVSFSTTSSLAWTIIVESALLNDRLMTDIKEVMSARGCGCSLGDNECWVDFYLPNPSPHAREVFNDYVRCRWPIQVFAIDPVAQDQNIADSLARRRELQLAIAISAANGETSSGAAARMMRRLEADFDTIALNRTSVGFSHGSDTFGWRFYPRFQTPPTPGVMGALGETIFGGDRACDLKRRQLEPGMRECIAMVLMPSFVRYVDINARSTWFSLTNPRKKQPTMREGVELGQAMQTIKRRAHWICSNEMYRPVDVSNIASIVKQLERRLPNQEMMVQVPHENTLGGFELFSNGQTDLAPELRGFYGAPGISTDTSDDCKCDAEGIALTSDEGKQCAGTCCGTTIFLVGDRFSVHDTKVVAGGRCVPFAMVSRQIMRVTIPGDVHATDGKVDVHVATPYGVSNDLKIPTVDSKSEESSESSSTPSVGFKDGTLRIKVELAGSIQDENKVAIFPKDQSFVLEYSDAQLSKDVLKQPTSLSLAMSVRNEGEIVPGTSEVLIAKVKLDEAEYEIDGKDLLKLVEKTGFIDTLDADTFGDETTITRTLHFNGVPKNENAFPFALKSGLTLEVKKFEKP